MIAAIWQTDSSVFGCCSTMYDRLRISCSMTDKALRQQAAILLKSSTRPTTASNAVKIMRSKASSDTYNLGTGAATSMSSSSGGSVVGGSSTCSGVLPPVRWRAAMAASLVMTLSRDTPSASAISFADLPSSRSVANCSSCSSVQRKYGRLLGLMPRPCFAVSSTPNSDATEARVSAKLLLDIGFHLLFIPC